MTTETRTDPRKNFVPRLLPWLLAAAMLAVYWFTLNRWVSLLNLMPVAKISGWTWQPEVFNPLSLSGHLSVPLAAGDADSARVEFVFRRVRGAGARPAGAVGGVAAARPDGRAAQARSAAIFHF